MRYSRPSTMMRQRPPMLPTAPARVRHALYASSAAAAQRGVPDTTNPESVALATYGG
jgi:hypothetical protein